MSQRFAGLTLPVTSMLSSNVRETRRIGAKSAGSQKVKRMRRQQGRPQSGFVMISALVAIVIVTTSVTAGLLGVSTASKVTNRVSVETTAASIAASQIDFVRAANFVDTGNSYGTVSAPTGYSVTNSTAAITGGNQNIQAVTITVSRNGDQVLDTTILKARNQ